MANQEQLAILKQGVNGWNRWRNNNSNTKTDLTEANLAGADLREADLRGVDLRGADLRGANLRDAKLDGANLTDAILERVSLMLTRLVNANLHRADLSHATVDSCRLDRADLTDSNLQSTHLKSVQLAGCDLSRAKMSGTAIAGCDLSKTVGLEDVSHLGPSNISPRTFVLSKSKIPERFLRGCGLNDWEIESVKLYDPDLSNDDVNKILYRIYDQRATQALQISPLFISYSHIDGAFVDKIGKCLQDKGIRYWRDVHEMKAGRIETQIDRGIRQNPTVLLILSEHSIKSDWVEHEVRTGRQLEKELGRDILCPVALDDSWKSSRWPKRVMEKITEYNILDFSAWQDDSKFDGMFRRLIDGLELFYKG